MIFCLYSNNKKHSVFYVGITHSLLNRIYEHKQGLIEGFTKQYNVNKLVYYEIFDDPKVAILREKRLKRWNREWKVSRISHFNEDWRDLYSDIVKEYR
ncbi:GIY-YIG nuclease family protein [Candidatus Falkowbacteria bacterium]|nr:MAG: GIY-YIG nuclease family protein [Candidatus Falkowbacteria bacterium]